MEWELANKHLEDIYAKGGSKKFKFMDKKLCGKFVARVGVIEAAETIFDLREPPSMEFEALQGYDNRFSIRLDKKHRVEFEIDFEDEDKTFGFVTIVTVSKHYQ
ncbi:MAG: type II toxin-antitoxin system RelE/ParE family toxin [Spirochaetales bacterium]|jgi:proteic killer suppression protein|nr:type II toxin-antitoxin system RelE/ParE family toxin [Spirochaetales bacterium]